MADMVLGIFSEREHAEEAIEQLKDDGYDAKDISIVVKDTDVAETVVNNTGANVVDGASSGAVTGGALGALAGLLVGIGAITLPGIGALLIGGPLAAALGLTGAAATTVSGAVTGALAGGFVGALVGLGIPEEEARVYEDHIRAGGILLAVPVREGTTREARAILADNHADKIRTLSF
jgi:uncharacterized membrane protein